MPRKVITPPMTTPAIHAALPPPVRVTKTNPEELVTRIMVRARLPCQDLLRSCRRKIGNSPKTSMEKRVNEKTWVVEGRRDASTVDAIIAEFVEIDAGRLSKH